jgi:DNA-binding NarL/FixJ family response regulator
MCAAAKYLYTSDIAELRSGFCGVSVSLHASELNSYSYVFPMKSIFIVDDHDIVRFGLEVLLKSNPGFSVLGYAATVQAACSAIAHWQPDLLITDMSLPDSHGLDTVRAMVKAQTPRPVLVVSMHDELIYAEQVLGLGAQGYLMKEKAQALVVHAANELLQGNRWVSPQVSAQLLNRMVSSRLRRPTGDFARSAPQALMSLREVEVLEKIGRGKTTKEIAYSLELSARTVDVHRASIKKKLGLRSGAEVVAFAVSRL